MAEFQISVAPRISGFPFFSELLLDGSLLASHFLPSSVLSLFEDQNLLFDHLERYGFFFVEVSGYLEALFKEDSALDRRQFRDFFTYDFLLFVLPGKMDQVKTISRFCRISSKPFSKKEIEKIIVNKELLKTFYATYTEFHVKGVCCNS